MEELHGEWNGRWFYEPSERLAPPGGFGVVHPGHSPSGIRIAVKAVQFGQLPERLVEREAEIAAKVRDNPSEHLIKILDVAHTSQALLIVMERADGSLADVLDQIVGDVPRAIGVLTQAARGLQELHNVGVFHRDLKPGNVLRVGETWKLSDFGIARDSAVGTQTPTFLGAGTWAYMAPELWDNRSPTIKTDLYALGCVAFELLTGQPPFDGPDQPSYERQHRAVEVPPLPDAVDSGLRSLVARLLNKDPLRRPQDARAVIQRLDTLGRRPLDMFEERLRRQALAHTEARAMEATDAAQREEEGRQKYALLAQAQSDLEDLCQEVATLLGSVLPDLQLRRIPEGWVLDDGDTVLSVELWEDVRLPDPRGDPLAVAGIVYGANRGVRQSTALANVAFEAEDSHLLWNLYRFARGPGVPAEGYAYGPHDRAHGLERRIFLDPSSREIMHSGRTHVWQQTMLGALDVSYFRVLFAEAQALPEPVDWSS